MKLETLSFLLLLGCAPAVAGCDIDLGDFEGDTDAGDDDDDDGEGSESGEDDDRGDSTGGDAEPATTTDAGMSDDSTGSASSGADETGTAPAPGACDTASTDCETCLDCSLDGGSCEAVFNDCIDNGACIELITCYDICTFEADEDACVASCDATHADGVAVAQSFLDCALAECGGWCE